MKPPRHASPPRSRGTLAGASRFGSPYDVAATTYLSLVAPHVRRHLLQSRANVVGRWAREAGRRVLDVGCGAGDLVHLLRRKNLPADGIDVSAAMITLAKRGPGRFRVANVADLESIKRRYDVVLTFGVLQCAATPGQLAGFIRGIVGAVRKGGIVIAGDNNPWNPYTRLLMARHPMGTIPHVFWGAGRIARALHRQGARILAIHRHGWIPEWTPRGWLGPATVVERLCDATPMLRRFGAFEIVIARRT